jgi:hypothetical protein
MRSRSSGVGFLILISSEKVDDDVELSADRHQRLTDSGQDLDDIVECGCWSRPMPTHPRIVAAQMGLRQMAVGG